MHELHDDAHTVSSAQINHSAIPLNWIVETQYERIND